jgi:hypothetical protein
LSGQVTDRHGTFLRPQDWQPQSAVFHYLNKIDLPALAVQPGGRISDQRVGVSQATEAPNVRIAADRCLVAAVEDSFALDAISLGVAGMTIPLDQHLRRYLRTV